MKHLIPTGFIFLFLGIIFIFIGILANQEKTDSKFAVGGIIGFIPFGFGNDKKMLYFAIGLTVALFLFFIMLNLMKK